MAKRKPAKAKRTRAVAAKRGGAKKTANSKLVQKLSNSVIKQFKGEGKSFGAELQSKAMSFLNSKYPDHKANVKFNITLTPVIKIQRAKKVS